MASRIRSSFGFPGSGPRRAPAMTLLRSLFQAALCLTACLLGSAVPTGTPAALSSIKILRNGTQPSAQGPTDWFTGTVRVDALFPAQDPSRVSAAYVTFEPGARTAWHTHPVGQTLVVTAGCGLVQSWGNPAEEIRPGDVVRIPPGVKHWHGAAPTTAMTHIAIQEQSQGKAVDWLEKVSHAQYQPEASPERSSP